MHSRIFAIREVIAGKELPSMDDRTCVTEDELADALVPHRADYVTHVDEKDMPDDVEWLVSAEPCFEISREDGQIFVTLNVSKGLDILKGRLEKFLECTKKLNEKEWSSPFSLLRYEMSTLMDDEHGFFIATVSEDSGWYYETFDEWLRSTCGKFIDSKALVFIKFRVEDTFDYHF